MSKTSEKAKSGISFTSLLLLLFIALKLTGQIDWPWVWVLSPLWIPFVLAVGIVLTWLVIYLLIQTFSKK